MGGKPVAVREKERRWEVFGDGGGDVLFKTLISGDVTPSEDLTLGVAKLPPGETLAPHHHRQAEVYLVLAGEGVVRIGPETRTVEAGTAVFVPGGVVHACENTGRSEMRVAYVLAANSFGDVEYVFGARSHPAPASPA